MTRSGGDLERAFEAAGLWQLTICRRPTDGKWTVHAAYDAKDWTKRKTVSAPLTTDLQDAILSVVEQIAKLMPPVAGDLDDLL